ncbi:hypothetical protein GJ496_002461 [Pomphorhynchus laevis]|nr:hypothetical protein GJ496_002461 [Pomphorhynchus laevis]
MLVDPAVLVEDDLLNLSDSLNSTLNLSGNNNIQKIDFNSDDVSAFSLSSLTIPDWLVLAYKRVNIKSMFEWQYECLKVGGLFASTEHDYNKQSSANILYSAPTSAGKTFVAEILIFDSILNRRRGDHLKALFVVPFISTAAEKEAYFKKLLLGSDVRVGGMYGQNRQGSLKIYDLVICTFEKANSLVNHLVNSSDIGENILKNTLGIVVIDEIHMACLKGERRSATVRSLVAKLRKYGQGSVRIVAMSATIPKPASDLQNWLNADLYETDFRPVSLKEYAFFQGNLLEFPSLTQIKSNLNIYDLICPLVKKNRNVLIFCNSKAWCERLAKSIANKLPRSKESSLKFLSLIKSVTVGSEKIDSALSSLIEHRVAFHHAGLSIEERAAIETAYKRGYCSVLVATTTLCSGVNLPAHRVIIRSINKCNRNEFIDWLLYQQMIGRAGRTGQCDKLAGGDSILICENQKELKIAVNLLGSSSSPLETNLISFKEEELKRLILDAIGNDDCTLQTVYHFLHEYAGILVNEDNVSDALKWLADSKFVSITNRGLICQSQLGRACIAASFSPDEALSTFLEIQHAITCGIILDTDFHLLYLIASPCSLTTDEQWTRFLNIYGASLDPSGKRVADRVGVSERHIATRLMRGTTSDEDKCCRFYSALILNYLLMEWSVERISDYFYLSKGQVQQIQQGAVGRSFSIAQFTRYLNWDSLSVLLTSLTGRIEFGCSNRDLEDLLQLDLLNRDRAKVLWNGGIESVRSLAESDPAKISRILRDGIPFGNIISARFGNSQFFTYSEAAEVLVNQSKQLLGITANDARGNFNNESKDNTNDNLSAEDIFDGFEDDALAEHGVHIVKLNFDCDSFTACHQLANGDFAVSPSSDTVCICRNFEKLKKLIILDHFVYKKFDDSPGDQKIMYLSILGWFVNSIEKVQKLQTMEVKDELLIATIMRKLYEELIVGIAEDSFKFLIDVEMKSFLELYKMTEFGIWVNQSRLNECTKQLMLTFPMSNSAEYEMAKGKIKCLKDILEIISTNFVDYSSDGKYVRCDLGSYPTKTGRYFLSNPPLQNVPRPFSIAHLIINPRRIFTASSDDNCLISADYCHLELSVLALLTRNSFLKSNLKHNNSDPFTSIMNSIDGAYKLDRNKSKVLFYSMLYGAGPKMIAKYINTSVEDAAHFRSKFIRLCDIRLGENLLNDLTYFGKRVLPSRDLNSIVQSNASEIVKIGLVNVSKNLPELRLAHFIHDELVYECTKSNCEVGDVFSKLRNNLQQTYEGVVFSVNIRSGSSWGDLNTIDN